MAWENGPVLLFPVYLLVHAAELKADILSESADFLVIQTHAICIFRIEEGIVGKEQQVVRHAGLYVMHFPVKWPDVLSAAQWLIPVRPWLVNSCSITAVKHKTT